MLANRGDGGRPRRVAPKPSKGATVLRFIGNTLKKMSLVGFIYAFGYMNWSVGWFLGPIVYLVIRDQWSDDAERKRNLAKAAALMNEKDLILARLDELPAWVYFPDIERVEWVNKILARIWPNINVYVEDMFRDTIQPLINEKLKEVIATNFTFDRIILGSVPLRIGGIKIYDKNVSRNEIIMDVDVYYAGDCDVNCNVGPIRAGIRDIQLQGTLRVVMKPLIKIIPLIGGVQIFFLNAPHLDFDMVGFADILDIPGVSDLLRKTIIDTVTSIAVLPNKISIKLNDEVPAEEVKMSEPEGVLRVHLIEAKHLMRKDVNVLGKGKSDPYAVISLGADEFRTNVIEKTLDPKWDFFCEFTVWESYGQQLNIHVWDKDEASDDENLGRAFIDIPHIASKGRDDLWVTLEQAKHGMIHLRFTWLSLSNNVDDLKLALEETKLLKLSSMCTAILTVFLDSAENLPQPRPSSKPDPFAVIKVGNTVKETAVVMRTCNPVWEGSFNFLVSNPNIDGVMLKVIDKKTGTDLGSISYGIKNIFDKENMEIIKQPFGLLRSGPQSQVIWTLKLKVLKSAAIIEKRSSESMSDLNEPAYDRQDSAISEASLARQKSVENPDQAQDLVQEEFVEDSAVSLQSSEPGKEGLVHRTTSTSSSSGEYGLGRVQITLRYSVQRQRLIVVVHKIVNIPIKDPTSVPDPYIKLYILPERSKDSKRKTQVIKDNCNPIFDESFEYVISQSELSNKKLEVTVGSQKQLFTGKNTIGLVLIDLSALNLAQPFNSWYDLSP